LHEAVLQARVFVVDVAQPLHLALDLVALAPLFVAQRERQIAGHAARRHRIHHEAVAEGALRQALPVFAQARELRQAEGQCRVVAQRA